MRLSLGLYSSLDRAGRLEMDKVFVHSYLYLHIETFLNLHAKLAQLSR